jgi:hypothetical protein
MKKTTNITEVSKRYGEAYAAHYKTKHLHEALDLYKGVIAAHPNTREADYSWYQILNIVHDMVPKQELFDAQVALALARFAKEEKPEVKPVALPLAS